ncbi:MAG: MFS transporter [Pirellulales bacterium]
MPPQNAPVAARLTKVQWLVCVIASIGFAFDIYELLMLPLILPDALREFGLQPGTPEAGAWVGRLFYIPAFAGGIFGLLGGYLTDLLGRRRVLTWSILLYAFSAFAAGYSTSLEMLLFFRCTTFVGVCIEFVAAVAWLAELFPHPEQREKVLGYTQAFSSIGGLLVAAAYGLAVEYAPHLPAIHMPDFLGGMKAVADEHAAWRYTLMSGLIPAIPLIIIRPFLPESPAWAAKKAAGTLRRPSIAELFAPRFRRTTIVTTLMFACSYGAAFGAIQHMQRMVPGLADVKQQTEGKPVPEQKKIEGATSSNVTKIQEVGGLAGRFVLAYLAVIVISRRKLFRLFVVPGLVVVPLVFAYAATHSVWLLSVGMFMAGFFTVAQFSFWGNYLPRVYPIHLRGTGESFAANIGGRMIGTSFAALTSTIAVQAWVPGETPQTKLAYTAAGVALFVYLGGTILSFWLPEPEGEMAD